MRRLANALRAPAEGTFAVVSHGTAPAAFLGSVTDADPVELWQAMKMPDGWLLLGHELRRVDA